MLSKLFFSLIGKAVVGDSLMMLLSIVAYLAICLLGFIIILPRYRKQLISTPASSKKEFKGDYSKQSSVSKTLINRELKLFFSNATYTLNCGLSIILLIGGTVISGLDFITRPVDWLVMIIYNSLLR